MTLAGKHPADGSLRSSSTLKLDQELLKIKGTKDKVKRPFNSLDGSILSLMQTSPILGAFPPTVPPKTPGDPLVPNSLVHEHGFQQPIALPYDMTETPRLTRVPSGVVLITDIVLNSGTHAPSSAATSIRSLPTMHPFLPMGMTPLEDPSRPPPVPARRPETKPLASSDPVTMPKLVRIPVPSFTPEESVQEEEVTSSSFESSEGSPIMVNANPSPRAKSLSLRTVQPMRSNAVSLRSAPAESYPRPTLPIPSDSPPSPISDSPSHSLGATMGISNDFFAVDKHSSETLQQQQRQLEQQPTQQQRQYHSQNQHKQDKGVSQTNRDGPWSYPPPPSSLLPPPPPLPAATSPMRAPVKRDVSNQPRSFMTDPATLLRRLFNNPLYSDIDLAVDETTFHVHRGVLAEHCSYFREFYTNARGQEPTTEIRHMNCSDAPIIFERGRNFSIVQVDSDDDMTRHIVRSPPLQGRISTRRDRSALDPGGGGRDVLESDDEEELYLVDVEGRSSIGHGHGPAGSSRSARQQKSQYLPDPTRGVNSDMRSKSDTSLSSSLKVDPVLQSPTPPKSAPPSTSTTLGDDDGPFNSFSTAFIAVDQRNVGYSSHHFACFLQILYGLLHPVYLHEDDLLAVFRIAHIYGVPSLVSFLGERIWDTLELTTKTWPCLVRFSEKFCLENIKRRALMHASETRELWTVAVENLGLDDFKVFLRGIGQPDDGAKASVTGGREQKGDLRSLKDELLMMFLLVHYQDSASSKEFGSFLFHRDDEGNSRRNNRNSSHAASATLMRRLSRTHQHDSARVKIRQQLQRKPSMTGPTSLNPPPRNKNKILTSSSTMTTTTGSIKQTISSTDSLALGLVSVSSSSSSSSPSSSPPSSLRHLADRQQQQAQTTKVDKAKLWMTRFKRDCGWGGQVSLLE